MCLALSISRLLINHLRLEKIFCVPSHTVIFMLSLRQQVTAAAAGQHCGEKASFGEVWREPAGVPELLDVVVVARLLQQVLNTRPVVSAASSRTNARHQHQHNYKGN